MLLNLVTPLHEKTKRHYVARLMDDKVACMKEARKFERNYWDGERRYGYGGYRYIPGRWKPVAQGLIDQYNLRPGDRVLDLGCGKGFLLHELSLLMPELELVGVDRSKYALMNPPQGFSGTLMHGDIRQGLSFSLKEFDLVISLGTLHNLTLRELAKVLPQIQDIGKQAYVMVESFRNEAEWFNLCAWCLTAESLMRPEDWCFLYDECGYKGDYEFIYFT